MKIRELHDLQQKFKAKALVMFGRIIIDALAFVSDNK